MKNGVRNLEINSTSCNFNVDYDEWIKTHKIFFNVID
jgi:hypothetical protein